MRTSTCRTRKQEGSALYNNRGLYYRIIDENERKVSAPIKASAFRQKATLDYLEKKFELNAALEQKFHPHIKAMIERAFFGEEALSPVQFKKDMKEQKILVMNATQELIERGGFLLPVTGRDGHGYFFL